MGSFSNSTVFRHVLHLLLLLLLGQISKAASASNGVDVLSLLPARASLSHAHNAPPSSSSSWFSFATLEKDNDDEEAEEREGVVLACIANNIELALLQAEITREKIEDFKDSYTNVKFNMAWANATDFIPLGVDEDALEVCSVDQTCSMVLPSLPPATKPPPATDSEAAATLADMTNHILRFTYAYEQLVLDQSMNEDSFTEDMHDAYVNHGKLSKLLEQVLETCEVAPNFDIAPLHGKMHVTTSSPRTDIRGFSTLRQSLQGLDLLESMFGERVKLLEKVMVERRNEKDQEEEEEEEEEDKVVRRKNRRRMKGGHSRRNGKNKKGNKKMKRRRNYLD